MSHTLPIYDPRDRFSRSITRDAHENINRAVNTYPTRRGQQVFNTPYGRSIDNGPATPMVSHRLGVITNIGPNSEGDLSGAEYWVAWAKMVRNHADSVSAPPSIIENTDIPQASRIIPALNPSEAVGSHSLSVGTPITIAWDYCVTLDAPDPTQVKYYIVSSGSGGLPRGQYQGMSYMQVTQNQSGWSYLFAHEIL